MGCGGRNLRLGLKEPSTSATVPARLTPRGNTQIKHKCLNSDGVRCRCGDVTRIGHQEVKEDRGCVFIRPEELLADEGTSVSPILPAELRSSFSLRRGTRYSSGLAFPCADSPQPWLKWFRVRRIKQVSSTWPGKPVVEPTTCKRRESPPDEVAFLSRGFGGTSVQLLPLF